MPRSIETIPALRARQLKALAQVRGTLPRADAIAVGELYDLMSCGAGLTDKQLERVAVLSTTYMQEVV